MNPDFAGGHVAFAKVSLDLNDPASALSHLEKATKLSPDNLLAHSLLGETLILLRRPKDALSAFKMVLFLNPGDAKALASVRKWEFLTADEYSDDVFSMQPLFEKSKTKRERDVELERAVSLADAYTVRNDLDQALSVLEDAIQVMGPLPEIEKRHRLLQIRLKSIDRPDDTTDRLPDDNEDDELDFSLSGGHVQSPGKREFLESLLQRINQRRH